MVVQHNLQAMNSNRQLGITTDGQAKSTEKLSSGYKINRAADDAAGLAISEKMRTQIRGLNRASTNAQDGISAVQTAEGALNEVHDMLHRMNELATQAANDTNTSMDRIQISKEMDQLVSEIDRVSSTTQFNTMNLLDGTFTGKNLQVGSLEGQRIEISIQELSAKGLGLAPAGPRDNAVDGKVGAQGPAQVFNGKDAFTTDGSVLGHYLSVSSYAAAGNSMTLIQNAIDTLSEQRANLGAIQNRLEHTIKNLDTTAENTQAAESRIRDTDMAKEMVTYSKNNILAQAGQAMLAQANQATQGALSLLR